MDPRDTRVHREDDLRRPQEKDVAFRRGVLAPGHPTPGHKGKSVGFGAQVRSKRRVYLLCRFGLFALGFWNHGLLPFKSPPYPFHLGP